MALNFEKLVPTTPKAWADVLVHRAYDWQKTEWFFYALRAFTGVGLLLAEGDVHKVRRCLAVSFSYPSLLSIYILHMRFSCERKQYIN